MNTNYGILNKNVSDLKIKTDKNAKNIIKNQAEIKANKEIIESMREDYNRRWLLDAINEDVPTEDKFDFLEKINELNKDSNLLDLLDNITEEIYPSIASYLIENERYS